MKAKTDGSRIVLQVGSELRIKGNGDIIIDNPELELERQENVADAVLSYRFDARRTNIFFVSSNRWQTANICAITGPTTEPSISEESQLSRDPVPGFVYAALCILFRLTD